MSLLLSLSTSNPQENEMKCNPGKRHAAGVSRAERESAGMSGEEAMRESETLASVFESYLLKLQPVSDRQNGEIRDAQAIAGELRQSRLETAFWASHDALTRLPNRVQLTENLRQAIRLAKRHHHKVAVLSLDLDRFRNVNDVLDCQIGDKLLQAVAQRLIPSVRSTDSVSRLGGDEFAVVLSEVTDEQCVAMIVENMHAVLTAPYLIEKHELHIGVSIGISMYPDDADIAEVLLRCADAALDHVKTNGRNQCRFHGQ
jgi:diguanylate cyclase (GGDEF)-like protein